MVPPTSLAVYRVKKLEEFMKAEGLDLGRATFHKAEISFKDLLLKYGIEKVAISNFGNGRAGLVKIPESLLVAVEEAHLLFVKCNAKGYPYLTEKLVLARAKGLPVVNSSFLASWAERGVLPELEAHPVMCEQWLAAGNPRPLSPINPKLFDGQKFCLDVDGWMMNGVSLEHVIETLGGEVVDDVEASFSSKCYMISCSPVKGKEAFKPNWVVSMVVAGRELLGAKWRMVDETDEVPHSQVLVKLFRAGVEFVNLTFSYFNR